MKLTVHEIPGIYDGKTCYVHARACALDDHNLLLTAQKLDVGGSDIFFPLEAFRSSDCGQSFRRDGEQPGFCAVHNPDGSRSLACDYTHLLHKKTGVPLLCGHSVSYAPGLMIPVQGIPVFTAYHTYDISTQTYSRLQKIDVPEAVYPKGCATGCSQFIEEENGDILIPVSINRTSPAHFTTGVMRCSFDGHTLRFLEMSNELAWHEARGLCEGSLCKFGGKYYLTLRNDNHGFWSVSDDGRHFSQPKVWTWDTGLELPNYNTQQHWLVCGGKLYLVYTRKCGSNDHVFRHRAPLFIAQVDTGTMTLLRHTEQIAVPERGARLGNFGVTQISENKAIITVTEWMQPAGCENYGSNNALFITTVEAD